MTGRSWRDTSQFRVADPPRHPCRDLNPDSFPQKSRLHVRKAFVDGTAEKFDASRPSSTGLQFQPAARGTPQTVTRSTTSSSSPRLPIMRKRRHLLVALSEVSCKDTSQENMLCGTGCVHTDRIALTSCGLDRTRYRMESAASNSRQRQRFGVLKRSFHARFATRAARSGPGLLPQPYRYCARSVRVAPAGRCAQTETSTTISEPHRSGFLDLAPTSLASMEGCSGHL